MVFLFLEAALRIVEAGRGGGKEDYAEAAYTRHDPVLGWANKPGAGTTYRRREYTTEVRINALGMRGGEVAPQPAPGTLRVLALGDSFLEAYTVSEAESVSQVLQGALAKPGCPVEVLNGGVHAWSTDQQYLFWKHHGRTLQPRLVVLFLYYNDILYNDMSSYWGVPKPLLERQGDELVVTNAPVKEPEAKERPVDEEPLLRSALLEFVEGRLKRGAPRLWDRLAAKGVLPERGRPEPREELRVFKTGPTPRMNGAWLKTRQVLEALARGVEQDGGRFVLVYVPSRFEVEDDAWELTRYNYQMEDGGWDRDLVRQRIAAAGRELRFPVVDLTEPLRRATQVSGSAYFRYDNHWNATGHRVAGQEVASFLGAAGLVPCTPRP